MAAVTHGVTTQTGAAQATYVSNALTPTANDLLFFVVASQNSVAVGSVTDSQGLGFTKVISGLFRTSLDTVYLFVANNLAAASSMTLTFDSSSDQPTRCDTFIGKVSGMTRTGLSAIRQAAVLQNATASPISSPSFGFNCLTGNPTIEFMGSQESGMTPPTNWTERADVQNIEYHSRDSGFTSTNIGWADTVVSGYGIIVAEFDTSTMPVGKNIFIRQAVNRANTY